MHREISWFSLRLTKLVYSNSIPLHNESSKHPFIV